MKLYRLESPVSSGGDVFDLADPKGRISAFFIWNEGDAKPFQFSKPRAKAQPGIRLKDAMAADYLQANIGVPIFSDLARSLLAAPLADELAFHECIIQCEGQEATFYLAKTLRSLPLVDALRSEFRTLGGGEKLLTKAVFAADAESDFFIARDERYRERCIVSQRFVELCQSQQLNIAFADPV